MLAVALAIGSGHLGWQAWRASVVYAADPRNPYVYAQTVPDAVRMAARIRDLAALHADARAHAGVGHRAAARAVAAALVSPDDAARRLLDGAGRRAGAGRAGHRRVDRATPDLLDAALGDRYVSEFFGVRPDVLVTLYVERGLWDRFLARVARRLGEMP